MQTIGGKEDAFVGNIKRCDVQRWKTSDFLEKLVKVTIVVREVEGVKVGESFEEVT